MGRIFCHTHTSFFCQGKQYQYNNNVFVSIKIQTPLRKSTHPHLQSLMAHTKENGIEGKPCICRKKQAHAAQRWEGLVANWWSNLTIKSKMTSTRRLTLSWATAIFSFGSLLSSNITGDHRRETSHEMRSSSCRFTNQAEGQSHWTRISYLEDFLRLRISCSLRRCWNRDRRAWRLTKPAALRDRRKLNCVT